MVFGPHTQTIYAADEFMIRFKAMVSRRGFQEGPFFEATECQKMGPFLAVAFGQAFVGPLGLFLFGLNFHVFSGSLDGTAFIAGAEGFVRS